MKLAVILSISFASILAQAEPRVGDRVTYSVTMRGAGVASSGTMSFELTAYDAEKNEWTQSGERVLDGKVEHKIKKVPGRSVMTDAMIGSLLSRCKKNGGKKETLTLSMGSILTCRLPVDNGTVWMADVPLMRTAKMIKTEDGIETETTLIGFSRGQ